jgi:hypothetical protein
MMLSTTAGQPYLALLFLSGGFVAYFMYEAGRLISTLFPLKLIGFLTDFFSVVFIGLFYLLLSEALNYGEIAVFTVLSYLGGMFLLLFSLRSTIRPVREALARRIAAEVKRRKQKLHNFLHFLDTKRKRRKHDREEQRIKRQGARLQKHALADERHRQRTEQKRKAADLRLRKRAEDKRKGGERAQRPPKVANSDKRKSRGGKTPGTGLSDGNRRFRELAGRVQNLVHRLDRHRHSTPHVRRPRLPKPPLKGIQRV